MEQLTCTSCRNPSQYGILYNKGSYFHCHNCVPQKISSVCNKCNQKITTLYVYESNGNYNTVTVPCACSIQK